MDKTQNWVMVLEKGPAKLDFSKDDKYVLEGVFAEFGVKNNNNRIYLEKEYLPHLEYLKKKISEKALFGELDHPEKFETSLKNVSHVIESLEYDKENRRILGRVRLLDTDSGKNAKALIDGGIQLSISSRSAGVVKENNEVQIKRIFTYDLVADPGFANAQLNRINESLGINDDNIAIYQVSEDSFSEAIIEELYKEENKKDIKNMSKDTTYVTKEMLETYTQHIREEFKKITNFVEEKFSDINFSDYKDKFDRLTEEGETISKYVNYMGEKINTVANYCEYLLKQVGDVAETNSSITKDINIIENYNDHISDNFNNVMNEVDNIKSYVNYIKENLNLSINFAEQWAKETETISEHNSYIVDEMNIMANYIQDEVSENMNVIANFQDKMSENMNVMANYIQDEVSENLNNSILFSEHIVKNMGNASNENLLEDEKIDINNIVGKIDTIIESVKKQKTDQLVEKDNFPYFKILGSKKQKEFLIMENSQKQRVMEAVKKRKPMNEQDFVSIWKEVLTPQDPKLIIEGVIDDMPENYKPIWENLDEKSKNIIISRMKFYKLSTPYQVKHFWISQKELNEMVQLETLNESYKGITGDENRSEYLKRVSLELQKYNK